MKPKIIGIVGAAGPLAGVSLLQRVFTLASQRYGCYRSMNLTNRLGESINSINKLYIECMYASSFFKFCADIEGSRPYLGPIGTCLNVRDSEIAKYFDYLPTNKKG